MNWGENGVDLPKGVLIDFEIGAVIFTVTILCVTKEESRLHSLEEVAVVVKPQIFVSNN